MLLQVKALTNVKASTLQLLPYYMRIGATLNELFPDIGQGLAKHAEDEFASLLVRPPASRVSHGPLPGRPAAQGMKTHGIHL